MNLGYLLRTLILFMINLIIIYFISEQRQNHQSVNSGGYFIPNPVYIDPITRHDPLQLDASHLGATSLGPQHLGAHQLAPPAYSPQETRSPPLYTA